MSGQALDRSQALPLWAQLEADLRRRLDAGEFDDGRFPTDLALTDEYEVSRHTVREAIRHLNSSGVLKRERGRGTVVNRSEFEQPLGTLYSLFRTVEGSGIEQTSEVLELAEVTDAVAADRLGLEADAPLVLLARLRLAGGEPLAIDRAWLPATIARPLLDCDWTRTALYDELERIGAPVPNQGWERLTPVIPSRGDRGRLDLKASEAAFFLERVGRRDDAPVEWRTTIIRGDRYRFVAEWSKGATAELRPSSVEPGDGRT